MEEYVNKNWKMLNFYAKNDYRIGIVEMMDVLVPYVYVHNLMGMCITFKVGLEIFYIYGTISENTEYQ